MRVLGINTYHFGSTGTIMNSVSEEVIKQGGESITFATKWKNLPENKKNQYYFGFYLENCIHYMLGKYFGLNNKLSYIGTMQLIRKIKKFNPDIIHLHNILSPRLCLPMLFKYIKKNKIKVVWTLHDCWAFTGHCTHFEYERCDKWKNGCYNCNLYHAYPTVNFDNSKQAYNFKKKTFTSLEYVNIVTPSKWLADNVNQSFLNIYPVNVINNGIDLEVFKPTDSDFRNNYHILAEKFVILGVSFGWGKMKGFDVFINLSKNLDERFQIVLVGTDDNTDKLLPSNIISIHRTQNQKELAEIYSAADLFVNPTREDTFPTVNIEALACGTPVLTFKTGGSPECIDETCGSVVEYDDIDAMEKEIIRICQDKPYSEEACISQAQNFDKSKKFEEYINLYKEILK